MSEPSILIVLPDSMRPSDKAKLSNAGVVVVEVNNPASVKFIRAGVEVESGALLTAAIRSLTETNENFAVSAAKSLFCKLLANSITGKELKP